VLEQQRGRARRCVRREHGIDAALEAARRLARQLVPAAHPRDDRRREVRGLEGDRGGAVVDLGLEAAHGAGQADRAAPVGDQQVVVGQRALDVVEGLKLLPRACAPHDDRALQLAEVERVQRLAGLEHHIVGDVDRERHGAHAAHRQPAAHPVRRRRRGVEADDRAQREQAAGVERLDGALVRRARLGGREGVERRGVAQLHAVLVRELARDTAHRQAEAHVGGDRDVEDHVAEADHGTGVGADLGRALRQHHDAVVVVAEAELALAADHAVGDLAVGLARGDAEVAGQHRARQRDDDGVALDEVAGAADDAALTRGVRVAVRSADLDPAEADRLLEAGELLDLQDAADHERAGDTAADDVDVLELEPDRDEALADALGGLVGGDVDVLAQPRERDAHRVRPPCRTGW
jgi:hypothetical protein